MVSQRSGRKADPITAVLAVVAVAAYALDFRLHGNQAWWHVAFLIVLAPISPGWQYGVDLDRAEREGTLQYLVLSGHDQADIERLMNVRDRVQRNVRLGIVCLGEIAALLLFGHYSILPYVALWFLFGAGALLLGVTTIWAIVIALRGKTLK